VSYGLLLAFLCTVLHIVVDHGVGGQSSFALLPHPCAAPVHSQDDGPGVPHHDPEEDPGHGHHPTDHQAETHSHFTGYPAVSASPGLHVVPSTLATGAYGIVSPILNAAALCGSTTASPPSRRSLALHCGVLRI